MATWIQARGACVSRVTSGERHLAERFEQKFDDYLLRFDVPIDPKQRHSNGYDWRRTKNFGFKSVGIQDLGPLPPSSSLPQHGVDAANADAIVCGFAHGRSRDDDGICVVKTVSCGHDGRESI